WNSLSSTSACKGDRRMSALTDAIFQNTLGNSEGFPLGLPTSYSWYGGWNPYGVLTPPSDFSAVTGWGQIYPELGQPVVAGNIEMTGFQTWLHLTNGTWVEAQNPSMGVQ